MALKRSKSSPPAWWRAWLPALAILMVAMLVFKLREITATLITAFCFAYILNPTVDRIERLGLRRPLAIFILLAWVVLLIMLASLFFIPMVIEQLQDFFALMPRKLVHLYERLDIWLQSRYQIELPKRAEDLLSELRFWVEQNHVAWLRPLGTVLQSTFTNTVEVILFLLNLVLLPTFTIYLLLDFHQIRAEIKNLVPRRLINKVNQYLHDLDTILATFLRGQLLLILVLAVYYSCGFLLVGVPMAIVVGLISGLGHLVPYLGPTLSLLMGLILILADFSGIQQLLGFFAVVGLAQLLESFVLTPRLVGKRLGLSPLHTILSLLIFGKLLGFLGLLLAIPLSAMCKIAWGEIRTKYQESALYQRPE